MAESLWRELLDKEDLLIFGAVLVASAVVLFVARRVAIGLLERWAGRTASRIDDMLLHSVRHPSYLWVLALSLYIALGTSSFSARYVDYGLKALYVIIVLSITFSLANLTSRLVRRYIEKTDAGVTATGLSQSVIKGFILAIGLLIILNGLGVSITPLLTALGVGGLAVALALQDTLSNFFAGLHILLERPIKVGDYIKLDSGEEGYVMDVGWRTTRIRKLQNNIVVIPNSKLAQSVITNFCLPEKRMSLLIPIGVSYESDPDDVERILVEEAKAAAGEVPGLLADPPPFVRFIPGFGDFSLDFTLICQVSEFVDQYLVQHELRKRIFRRFKDEGIEIPFPIRTVHLKKT